MLAPMGPSLVTRTQVRRPGSLRDDGHVPSTTQLLAFVVTSTLFIQVPGPSLLFTLGRALTVGRREALLSVVGNALGLLAQVLAVALGLGAMVATSASAFAVLKLAGAAWLVWLGVQAIRTRGAARHTMGLADRLPESRGRSLRAGFVVGVSNPKTIVFFLAFLPQFTDSAAGHVGLQVVLLGVLFGLLACVSDSMWVLVAARARHWFVREPGRLDAVSGVGGAMMIGLGITVAATE